MKSTNFSLFRIRDEHRHTIRDLNSEDNSLLVCDYSIAFDGRFRNVLALQDVNQSGMNLA